MTGGPGYVDGCTWCLCSERMRKYHDEEWSVPLHDGHRQFKSPMMEVMQCEPNWNMMIQKRGIFRQCFDGSDYDKTALYEEEDIKRIPSYEGMIKPRKKVEAAIHNAGCFQKVRQEYDSFSSYVWGSSRGKIIPYASHQKGKISTQNALSQQFSQDLRKRSFKYLGPVMVYSHLQACGVINDHVEGCFRYHGLIKYCPTVKKRDRKQAD